VARVAIPVATVALAAAACGSGSGAKTTPAAAVGSQAASTGVTLATKSGPAGTYLTDGTGKSVYEFASDTATMSTCTGACVTYWPPLTSSSPPTAGSGITASDIGSLTLPDGTKQVTYNGHPLYYFALDKAPGDTKGQGLDDFGAKWWLLSPSGTVIKTSTTAPASSASSYGY
jgi:predicted lipoprotein with Yx(FWY)xxD motif